MTIRTRTTARGLRGRRKELESFRSHAGIGKVTRGPARPGRARSKPTLGVVRGAPRRAATNREGRPARPSVSITISQTGRAARWWFRRGEVMRGQTGESRREIEPELPGAHTAPPDEPHPCATGITRDRRRGRPSAGCTSALGQIMRGRAVAHACALPARRCGDTRPQPRPKRRSGALGRTGWSSINSRSSRPGLPTTERSAAPAGPAISWRSSRPGCRPRGTSRPPGRRRSA